MSRPFGLRAHAETSRCHAMTAPAQGHAAEPHPKRRAIRTGEDVIFDLEEDYVRRYLDVRDYTMISLFCGYNLLKSVDYVVDRKVPGAIVECGVWRGGCMMMAATQLLHHGVTDREIWLYDTFAGMTEPGELDVKAKIDPDGRTVMESARGTWTAKRRDDGNDWCFASLDEVRGNLERTGYPDDRLHYVQGDVAETLRHELPERIAILRLDTDWYESTRIELDALYPRLSVGGVLIVDDYGGWLGQQKAVDEYFAEHGPILLNRIDRSCRVGVKIATSGGGA